MNAGNNLVEKNHSIELRCIRLSMVMITIANEYCNGLMMGKQLLWSFSRLCPTLDSFAIAGGLLLILEGVVRVLAFDVKAETLAISTFKYCENVNLLVYEIGTSTVTLGTEPILSPKLARALSDLLVFEAPHT